MGLIKRIFGNKKKNNSEETVPGRTFKRILTGDYFGLRNPDAPVEAVQKAKEEKIRQIRELELKPVYLRYRLKNGVGEAAKKEEIEAAYVSFQKEEYDPKLSMVHVTEISFLVLKDEFEEFETMANVSLEKDFRNFYTNGEEPYIGKDRRKKPRQSPFENKEDL